MLLDFRIPQINESELFWIISFQIWKPLQIHLPGIKNLWARAMLGHAHLVMLGGVVPQCRSVARGCSNVLQFDR